MADVARASGLSMTTVSFALNGRSDRVSADTQRRVLRIARELDYKPNWRARALALRRSELIALASARDSPLASGMNEQISAGLCSVLHRRGYSPLLVSLLSEPQHWQTILSPDRVDGCLLSFPLPPDPMTVFRVSRLPTVVLNAESELPVPHVVPDDVRAAAEVTQLLIEHGHRRVAFVYPDDRPLQHFSVQLRRQGMTQVLREAGGLPVEVPFSIRNTANLLAALRMAVPVTAAVVYDHWLALNLLVVARQAGVKLPDELSVVTFNDDEVLDVSYLPLTTVALPGTLIGSKGAEMLIDRIEQHVGSPARSTGRREVIRLPGSLIIRQSVVRQSVRST
jgi:LacI family transcriptional regulator